jgi:hypothetical protein
MNEAYGARTLLVAHCLAGRLANPNFAPSLKNVQSLAELAVAAADACLDRMKLDPTIPIPPEPKPKIVPITNNLKCRCAYEGWHPECAEHKSYSAWIAARDAEVPA